MYNYPEKEKIAVVNRYLNGETISKISQTTKISRTTIYFLRCFRPIREKSYRI